MKMCGQAVFIGGEVCGLQNNGCGSSGGITITKEF
jgi:hypothetical protein